MYQQGEPSDSLIGITAGEAHIHVDGNLVSIVGQSQVLGEVCMYVHRHDCLYMCVCMT